jgi:hypothetical protein
VGFWLKDTSRGSHLRAWVQFKSLTGFNHVLL